MGFCDGAHKRLPVFDVIAIRARQKQIGPYLDQGLTAWYFQSFSVEAEFDVGSPHFWSRWLFLAGLQEFQAEA